MVWVLVAASSLVPGPAWAKSEFKVGGRVIVEFRSQPGFRNSSYPKDVVVQAESRRHGGVKAGAELRASDDSRGVELREVYLDYRPKFEVESDDGVGEGGESRTEKASWKLIAGRIKKRFGLEWDASLEEVLPLARSLVHRKLSSLGYTGRDTAIAFQAGDNDEPGPTHHLSFHTSEGLNGALLYRFLLKRGERSVWGSYSLFQVEYIDRQKIAAGAQAFTYTTLLGDWSIEAQLAAGVDAFESEYQRLAGKGRTVFFSGAQVGVEWQGWKLRPFAMASAVLDDLARLGRSSQELAGGLRFYFQPRFYAGIEGRWVGSKDGTVTAFDRQSLAMFALRYFF